MSQSIEGQGHFFTIYFAGFVCFVFIRPTYQMRIYRTIGPLVSSLKHISNLNALHLWYSFQPKSVLFFYFIVHVCNIQIMW